MTCFIELYNAKHMPVIRDRGCIHAESLHSVDIIADAVHPIEQIVLSMSMKMDERHKTPFQIKRNGA